MQYAIRQLPLNPEIEDKLNAMLKKPEWKSWKVISSFGPVTSNSIPVIFFVLGKSTAETPSET